MTFVRTYSSSVHPDMHVLLFGRGTKEPECPSACFEFRIPRGWYPALQPVSL